MHYKNGLILLINKLMKS